jgi:peroxin-3
MDETSDLIDSPSFSHVQTLLLDAAFSHLVDNKIATLAYKLPATSASPERIHELVGTDARAKLANILATFCRQAHAIGSGASNDYLSAMEGVRDLSAFAAVVYSSNFEFEAPDAAVVAGGSNTGSAEAPSSWLGTSALPTPAGPGRAVPDEDPLPPGLEGEASLLEGGDFQKAWEKATAKDEKR